MRSAIALVSLAAFAFLPAAAPAAPAAPAARAARAARAQTGAGVDVGLVTAFDEPALLLGVRAAPARAGRGGADLALATLPEALAEGFLVGLLDLDLTWGAPLGADAVLLPRFGGSMIFALGEQGDGGAFGYNLGLGLLARTSPTLGLRIDYTHRRFIGEGASLPLSSVTVGVVWIH